jgi:hypothetical protein
MRALPACEVNTTTVVAGCFAMIPLVASMPSIPGIEMSMSTMSGWYRSTSCSASEPLVSTRAVRIGAATDDG